MYKSLNCACGFCYYDDEYRITMKSVHCRNYDIQNHKTIRNPKSSVTEWEFEEFMKNSIEWKKKNESTLCKKR